jgi:hypothetical protein
MTMLCKACGALAVRLAAALRGENPAGAAVSVGLRQNFVPTGRQNKRWYST